MVHPGISAMLFTPICPHALSSRPLLLPDGVELRIQVLSPPGTYLARNILPARDISL